MNLSHRLKKLEDAITPTPREPLTIVRVIYSTDKGPLPEPTEKVLENGTVCRMEYRRHTPKEPGHAVE